MIYEISFVELNNCLTAKLVKGDQGYLSRAVIIRDGFADGDVFYPTVSVEVWGQDSIRKLRDALTELLEE